MPEQHICHVTSVHVPTDGRILYRECRSVARRYRVSLVCFGDTAAAARAVDGISVVSAGPRPTSRLRRWSARDRLATVAAGLGADLYHLHDPELIGTMLRLQAQTRAPVVYDVHEHYPDAVTQRPWIPRPARPLLARIADIRERRSAPRFAGLVVADDALQRRFEPLNAETVTVRNYPPLDLFDAERVRPADAPPVLVYAGSISLVRGLAEMAETIRRVRERYPLARLVLAGSPTEDGREPLARLHADPDSGVEHIGPVPYGELGALLASADIGLSLLRPHPKYEKNVPSKVFDYMAAGLPYVASDIGPLGALTGGAGGVLVPAGDAVAAAEAVLGLLGDREDAAARSREGRRAVEERLTWEREAGALLGQYGRLLAQR